MKYERISDLPDTLQDILPEEAQKLYLEGYSKGWETYDEETSSELNQEAVAHRQGWRSVKRAFEHDEDTGKWYPRGEAPEEEEEEGLIDKVTDIF